MRQNGLLFRKWRKMGENGRKWVKMNLYKNVMCCSSCRSGGITFFLTYSLKKRSQKTAENGRKWAEMKKNGWKWVKMGENERKWFSFISGHFGSFSIIFDHFASFVKRGRPFYLENGHSLKGQTVCGYSKNSSLFTYY